MSDVGDEELLDEEAVGVDADAADGIDVSDEELAEERYKRRIGVSLAVLAVLGAFIAVLATNAGTEESRTTRQATRLGSEAQTRAVLDTGLVSGIEQIDAEVEVLADRSGFSLAPEVAVSAGVELVPNQVEIWIAEASRAIEASLGEDEGGMTEAAEQARELKLLQTATVAERITWNARASQYETVLTVLAVALFLVGFTLAVGRKVRPPIAVPGLILAIICFGWSMQIYMKPIPRVDPEAVAATARGDVAIGEARYDDARTQFDVAIEEKADYAPAWEGRGTARLVQANPDVLNTMAFTDTDPAMLAEVQDDLAEALHLDATEQRAQAVSALVAIMATDWDVAADRLDEAVATNGLSPALQLWRAAVAVARDEPDAAEVSLDRVAKEFKALQGTDVARRLPAQYLSLLEWIIATDPETVELAERFRESGVAQLTAASVGRKLVPVEDLEASLTIDQATFADGRTTVALTTTGVPDDATITLAGYERPARDASWVQTEALFYVGPTGSGSGFTFDTPRACAPVEFRFDLYVEGVFVESVTSPGVDPTC